MPELDRSRYIAVTRESVAAAEEASKRYMGGPLRMEKGSRNYYRFMPAFKVDENGVPKWWSYGMRHYGVPILGGEEGKKTTIDCPQTIGGRCLVCENKKLFQQLGQWDDFKGCSPRKRVYFNVIDIQNLEAGVQVLEDGPKLWGLLREEFEEENELLFDPFEGSVLTVISKDADPWRKIKYPKAHQCSLDQLHVDGLTWALPENLEDLDDQWEFPTLEEQQKTFATMFGGVHEQLAAPAPQVQIGALAAAPAQAAVPAPVAVGVAAILDEEVIEGEVVEEPPAPAPASAPASAPAPVAVAPTPAASPPVPAPGAAAILEEANATPQATPAAVIASAAAVAPGAAAILEEANEAASPVPGDAAPAPTGAVPAQADGGSAVLASYAASMEDEEGGRV